MVDICGLRVMFWERWLFWYRDLDRDRLGSRGEDSRLVLVCGGCRLFCLGFVRIGRCLVTFR